MRYDFPGLFNVFAETPYIEGSSHVETSQLTCNASRRFRGARISLWEVFPNRLVLVLYYLYLGGGVDFN